MDARSLAHLSNSPRDTDVTPADIVCALNLRNVVLAFDAGLVPAADVERAAREFERVTGIPLPNRHFVHEAA